MTKVAIDMTMSLDGFVAGPGDGKEYPLGKNGGMRIFDWYFSGKDQYRNKLFRPEPRVNLDQVKIGCRPFRLDLQYDACQLFREFNCA